MTVRDGKTVKERTIEKIRLLFEPQEAEALFVKKSLAAAVNEKSFNLTILCFHILFPRL